MRTWSLLALLCSCAPENEIKETPQGSDGGPDIEVPAQVLFDGLESGESTTELVAIQNVGPASLQVSGVAVQSSTAFSTFFPEAVMVESGESFDVAVTFTPINIDDSGFLVVSSNDPLEPQAYVELVGSALLPVLQIEPDPIDFGNLGVCRTEHETVTLTNIGGAVLDIATITSTGEGVDVTREFDLPLSLEPDESETLEVRFLPLSVTDYEAEIWVTSNEPVGARNAFVSGAGVGSAVSEAVDTFRQPDGPWEATDVLFYVDRSLSMENNLTNLENNFNIFLSTLAGVDADYQIMVVTRDDGCHNGEIITPDTANPEAVFKAATRGDAGDYTEAGVYLARQALMNTDAGECNEGFVRKDSKTMAVLVSDEPDQSPTSVATLVSEMLTVAPTLAIVAIAGDVPLGCGLTADPGTGYDTAVHLTGGHFLSICSDEWGDHLEVIAELATEEPTGTFELTYVPDPASLDVTVNSVPASAWDFDDVLNAVEFRSGAWPDPGDWIEAAYQLPAECSEAE